MRVFYADCGSFGCRWESEEGTEERDVDICLTGGGENFQELLFHMEDTQSTHKINSPALATNNCAIKQLWRKMQAQ